MKGEIPIELVAVIIVILVVFGIMWLVQDKTIGATVQEGLLVPFFGKKKPAGKKGIAANFSMVSTVLFFLLVTLALIAIVSGPKFIKSIGGIAGGLTSIPA